jgi:DNA-binding GntR family transcriptional regulator
MTPSYQRPDAPDRLGERIYADVKAHVLSTKVVSGERLDVPMLAEAFQASITPVRAALHRLVGEGLIEAYPNDGFRLPNVTEPGLRDLYGWNAQIVSHALRHSKRSAAANSGSSSRKFLPAIAASEVFCEIAARSSNGECRLAVERLNDRLSRPRLLEVHMLQGPAAELTEMLDQLRAGEFPMLRRAIQHYHNRRIKRVGDIVRLLYSQP